MTTLIRILKEHNVQINFKIALTVKNTWDILNNVMNKKKPNPLPDTNHRSI